MLYGACLASRTTRFASSNGSRGEAPILASAAGGPDRHHVAPVAAPRVAVALVPRLRCPVQRGHGNAGDLVARPRSA